MCEHTGCALLFDESWSKFWLFITLGTTSGFFLYSQTKFKPTILYWTSSQAIPNCNGKTSRICCSIASWYACLVYMHAPNASYGPSWCRAERRGKAQVKNACAKSYSRHQQRWPWNQFMFLSSQWFSKPSASLFKVNEPLSAFNTLVCIPERLTCERRVCKTGTNMGM